MNHVLFTDLSEDEKKLVKRLRDLKEIEDECTDKETAELYDLEEKFYDIVRSKAEEKNPEIDWNTADQSIFDIVADDRKKIFDCIDEHIKKEKYAAQKKYISEQREYCNLNLKKGTKARWREYAAKRGLSLSKYIEKLIEDDNSNDINR